MAPGGHGGARRQGARGHRLGTIVFRMTSLHTSRFLLLGSCSRSDLAYQRRGRTRTPNRELQTANSERRTRNPEPNLNTNQERRTEKNEPSVQHSRPIIER